MGTACNINRRGRIIRLVSGIVLTAAAVGMAAAGWPPWPVWGRVVQAAVLVSGLFGFFEAARGWCLLRGLGIRVPW
jgi:hypothetical protein